MLPLNPITVVLGLSLSFLACANAASTSNLSYPDTGWPEDALDEAVYLASSFTTNSAATSYRLDSITIDMGTAINASNGFKLELRSGTASSPGAVIAQLV